MRTWSKTLLLLLAVLFPAPLAGVAAGANAVPKPTRADTVPITSTGKTIVYVRLSSLTRLFCQAGKPGVLSSRGNKSAEISGEAAAPEGPWVLWYRKPAGAVVRSVGGRACSVRYGETVNRLDLPPGHSKRLEGSLKEVAE